MAANFIQKAIRHPGALHRALGVPQGQKIPEKKLTQKLTQAKKSGDTLMVRRINLARTLKKLG